MSNQSAQVIIGKNVTIGKNVSFGNFVIIYDNVEIGENCIIGDFVIIGETSNQLTSTSPLTKIGESCVIRSHALLYAGCTLGNFVHLGNRATIREFSIVGNHCSIGMSAELQGNCSIGDYSRLQSFVSVGQHTKIGRFVFVYPFTVFTNDPLPPSLQLQGVEIGDFTQVSAGVIMLAGAIIGKFSLISVNSKVGGLFEDDSFIEGNPGRRIGKLSKMPFFNKDGKRHYPWPYQYSTNMPWHGLDFDDWAIKENISLF